MRNGMRYIFILCLFLGFASCQEDVLQPSYKGKGRLVLKDVDISAEASAETVTRATSTFTAPTASELTYKVTDTQTGEVVYNQTGEFTSLVLDEGFYRLEASYGTENMGTAPYLYAATEEFRITTATETAKSLSVKLSCAIVHPAIADNLLEHYDTYKIEISDGTSIQEIPNNADFFVPAGKDYTLTLSGTNTLNEAKSNSWELKDVLVANRYTLNCNPDLPSFTLPEQMEGDVWSTFIYITPMTAANMSSKPEMTEKVLANIVYEASADGINWIQAINDNGKTVIKGLVANNQYTIRSRFGSIICTNSQQVTMESAEQLENGNFESVWNKKEINGGNGSWSRPLYCYYLPGWNTRNERTTKGGESATGWGTGVGYGVWWRWCSGTVPTADSSKDANAVEISTLAFYNKKVSGTWSRDEVYTYTRDNGTAYAGYLFTGTFDKNTDTYTLGIQHESRPTSISFDYKYFPVINDKCLAYAKVYNADKKEIASTIEFNSSEQEEYTAQTLKFEYNNLIGTVVPQAWHKYKYAYNFLSVRTTTSLGANNRRFLLEVPIPFVMMTGCFSELVLIPFRKRCP